MTGADARALEALAAAESGADVLATVAGWFDPDATAPTPEALAEWWPECPDEAREEYHDRAANLLARWNIPDILAAALVREPWKPLVLSKLWLQSRNSERAGRFPDDPPLPGHPLAPIVRAWIEWRKNKPTPGAPYVVTKRASLPRFEADGAHLPDYTPSGLVAPDQPFLPGFEPMANGFPHWLLEAFRLSGGAISQGGRLPLSLSLWFGAMVRLPIALRNGQWRTLTFPHRIEHEHPEDCECRAPHSCPFPGVDAVERWLWPDGWANRTKTRYAHSIAEGLHGLRDLAYMPIPGIGSVAVIFPSVIPKTRTDPLVEFTLRIPTVAAHGARFTWPTFARYAARGATVPRGYLSAMAHLHRSAHKGHPVTRMIAAPILGPYGQPVRRKGGAIVRSATEVIPNPQARFVPTLTDSDFARMVGYDPRNLTRYARLQGRKAFNVLAEDGHIELVRDGKGFRIFGSGG